MRFSLKTLLMLTTLLAATVAGLLNPVPLAACIGFSLVVGFMLLALIAAAQLKGEARAFWSSFALVGIGYGWLAMPASGSQDFGKPNSVLTNPENYSVDVKLCTSAALVALYEHQGYLSQANARKRLLVVNQTLQDFSKGSPAAFFFYPNLLSYLVVGQSSFTILFAWLGGMFGASIARRTMQAAC